jgi:hypothetical protein
MPPNDGKHLDLPKIIGNQLIVPETNHRKYSWIPHLSKKRVNDYWINLKGLA